MSVQSSGRTLTLSTGDALASLAEIDNQLRAYLAVAISPGEERIDIQRDALCEAWICLTTQNSVATAFVEAFRVARRLSAQWKRQQRAPCSVRCEGSISDSIWIASSDADQQYRLALWDYEDQILLPHLTRGQRAALEMHVMDELSDDEIASVAALRQSALRSLRHAAKERLRQLIREGEIPLPPTAEG